MKLDAQASLVILVLLVLTPPIDAGVARVDNDRGRAATDALIQIERQGFVGSVLVARGGAVVYAGDFGFGDVEHPAPSYWIASISKQFTAAAILLLQQQGKLDIDESIAEYLPNVPADRASITLLQLLTHTSGIPQTYAADGIKDRSVALDSLLATKLESAPGERFSYANDNYNILAIVVETVSGQTHEEFLRRQITDPAGMEQVVFGGAARSPDFRTVGHHASES